MKSNLVIYFKYKELISDSYVRSKLGACDKWRIFISFGQDGSLHLTNNKLLLGKLTNIWLVSNKLASCLAMELNFGKHVYEYNIPQNHN